MRHVDRLTVAQRVVLAIGLGVVLVVIAGYVNSIGSPFGANFGWFGYAPLTGNAFVPQGGADLYAWEQLLVWLGAVLAWTAGALVLFRRPLPEDISDS
jgi:heme/copper-type cytochrome/quinol oxidase subunit 1